MVFDILNGITKAVKKLRKSVDQSSGFIDDAIEKEHITSSIEAVKEGSGLVVQKAGELYQKLADKLP